MPTSIRSLKKQGNSIKTSTSALLTMPKLLSVDHNKLWKILNEMRIRDWSSDVCSSDLEHLEVHGSRTIEASLAEF